MLSLSHSSSASSFAAAAVAALSNTISSSPLCGSLTYQSTADQTPSSFTSNLPAFVSTFDPHVSHANISSYSNSAAFGYSPSISRLMPKQPIRYYQRGAVAEESNFFLSPSLAASSAVLLSPLHSFRQSSLGGNRSQFFSPNLPPAAAPNQDNDSLPLTLTDLSRQFSSGSSITGLPLPLSRAPSNASTILSSASSLSSSGLPSVASFTELNDLLQTNADEESSHNDLLSALRTKVKLESDAEDERDSPRSVHSGVDGVEEEEEFFANSEAHVVPAAVRETSDAWNESMVSSVSLNENGAELVSAQQNLRKRKSFSEVIAEQEEVEAADDEESEDDAQASPALINVPIKTEPRESVLMARGNDSENQTIGDCSAAAVDEMEMSEPQVKEEDAFESDHETEELSSPTLSPSSSSSSAFDSAASTPATFTTALPRRHDRELANRRERRRAADAQKRLNSLLAASNEYADIDEVWGMNRSVNQELPARCAESSLTILDVSNLAPSVGKGYLMMAVESKDVLSGYRAARLVYCKYVMFEDSVSVSSNNGRRNRRSDTHGLTTQMHLDKKTTVVLAPQECVRQIVAQSQKKKRCRKFSSALAASAHVNAVDAAVQLTSSAAASGAYQHPTFRILISCADHSNSISWRDEGEGRKQDYYHCLQFRRKQKYHISLVDEPNRSKSRLLWLHMLQTKGHSVSFLSMHAPNNSTLEVENENPKHIIDNASTAAALAFTHSTSSAAAGTAAPPNASSTRRSARIQRQSSSSCSSSSISLPLPVLNTSESMFTASTYSMPSPVSYSLSMPTLSVSSSAASASFSSSAASSCAAPPLNLWRGSSLICDDGLTAASLSGVGCSLQTQAP